jgi:hypothetical protein
MILAYELLRTSWYVVLSPSQNISKSKSNKFNVFGSKFRPNTFTFIDQFLLIFWDEENTFYKIDFYCFLIGWFGNCFTISVFLSSRLEFCTFASSLTNHFPSTFFLKKKNIYLVYFLYEATLKMTKKYIIFC